MFDCVDDSAEPIRCLEERELRMRNELKKTMSRGQTADAAADDRDARGGAKGKGGRAKRDG